MRLRDSIGKRHGLIPDFGAVDAGCACCCATPLADTKLGVCDEALKANKHMSVVRRSDGLRKRSARRASYIGTVFCTSLRNGNGRKTRGATSVHFAHWISPFPKAAVGWIAK